MMIVLSNLQVLIKILYCICAIRSAAFLKGVKLLLDYTCITLVLHYAKDKQGLLFKQST